MWSEEDFERKQAELVAAGVRMRGPSRAEQFAARPRAERDQFYESLDATEWLRLQWDWRFWGRPKQLVPLEPGNYDDILLLAGRGTGKTRTGSETVWDRIASDKAKSVCFVGPDWKDVRRNMVGGLPDTDSGFLDVVPPWYPIDSDEGVIFNQSKQEIYIPRHDCTVYLNTGETKEQRGGNFDLVWIDEPIKFRYLVEVLSNLDFALRRATSETLRLFTTTPKRQEWLRDLIMQAGTLTIHAVTEENRKNLARRFIGRLLARYGGTRLGDQEMGARILGDNENAIAKMLSIEAQRLGDEPDMLEVGVAVDPAVSTHRKSDDSGIVAAGRSGGKKNTPQARLCVLDDVSGRYESAGWADKSVAVAKAWGAKWIIFERNKIGDSGRRNLIDAINSAGMKGRIEIREAYSFKDKSTRHETTLSPLYDKQRVHHIGRFPELESQLTQWDPKSSSVSPNNLDALGMVATELMGLADPKDDADVDEQWEGFDDANRGFEVRGRNVL